MEARVLLSASARGAAGAMAMTGFRTVAASLGLLHQAPPEEIAEHGAAANVFDRVPDQYRPAAIQLAHWGYGTLGGAVFSLLPVQLRRTLFAGPVYGLAMWAAFEAGIAPLLGLRVTERGMSERVTLAADHALYGLLIAARPRSL